jgi:hypothetical protein
LVDSSYATTAALGCAGAWNARCLVPVGEQGVQHRRVQGGEEVRGPVDGVEVVCQSSDQDRVHVVVGRRLDGDGGRAEGVPAADHLRVRGTQPAGPQPADDLVEHAGLRDRRQQRAGRS